MYFLISIDSVLRVERSSLHRAEKIVEENVKELIA